MEHASVRSRSEARWSPLLYRLGDLVSLKNRALKEVGRRYGLMNIPASTKVIIPNTGIKKNPQMMNAAHERARETLFKVRYAPQVAMIHISTTINTINPAMNTDRATKMSSGVLYRLTPDTMRLRVKVPGNPHPWYKRREQ